MTTEVTTTPTADERRELALMKAIGFDRLAAEQRELAMNIAHRYELDPFLRHIVIIDGKPFVTRDALLYIAHRSGQFDGIETTTPEIVGDEWRCSATVWRKDMTHPFTYGGRYPVKGGNAKFAPEMAIKVAESMALRRAFNVAAPVSEERWDLDVDVPEPPRPVSLAERVATKAAEVTVAHEDESFTAIMDVPADMVEPDDFADMVPWPSLSKGEFNRRAVTAGITKAAVATAHGVLGLPPSTEMTPTDWGHLAAELGLS